MSVQETDGQERIRHILRTGVRNHSLSHAYIFNGPRGSGKRDMALWLAQAVYCVRGHGDACGECPECRKVIHGNHPDFHWIEPDGASVKIEQIRELQKEFAYRSSQARKKIYVIQQADRMTIQASNSLLKFLEEPIADVMAILLTENGQALLPTIKSRSQWLSFVPENPDAMEAALIAEGVPAMLARTAVRLAAGLPAARELARAEWFAEARTTMVQLAKETLTRFPAAMLTVQQKLAKGEMAERLDTILDLWLLLLRDMIQLQCGRREQMVFADQVDWMADKAFSRGAHEWVHAMEQVTDVQKRLRSHANSQLAVEKLIMDMQGG
ncbi:DNA polymerase III subunit delta' [Gorillibacterium timonense]|uniref:DNA polymerase III subunit delta' n=1 Tax=Gorillibacterium timonense TaxID=1689269 RepID=UPI00071E01B8|nr:DNA polymerase III subunit delta' [Gorillibacterium timonense]